jgi:hypothetical protein
MDHTGGIRRDRVKYGGPNHRSISFKVENVRYVKLFAKFGQHLAYELGSAFLNANKCVDLHCDGHCCDGSTPISNSAYESPFTVCTPRVIDYSIQEGGRATPRHTELMAAAFSSSNLMPRMPNEKQKILSSCCIPIQLSPPVNCADFESVFDSETSC